MYRQTLNNFEILSDGEISEGDLAELSSIITLSIDPSNNREIPADLEGRVKILTAHLPDTGTVALKTYRRGGVLGRVITYLYLRGVGASRAQSEFDSLKCAAKLGVRVPHPLAIVRTRGLLFYRNWLVLEYLAGAQNFVTLINTASPENLEKIIRSIVINVKLLIEGGLLHVDLHPGNVLVCPEGTVYIIDFDKAKFTTSSNKQRLRDFYICRWRRAAIKHNLPDPVIELFSSGLRTNA